MGPQFTWNDDKNADDMQTEYHFDYGKARPNRFALPLEDGSLVVVLAA